jgi:hypothetical protein
MSGLTESYQDFDKSEKKVKKVKLSKNPIRRQIEWNLLLFRCQQLSLNDAANNIINEIERGIKNNLSLLKNKS